MLALSNNLNFNLEVSYDYRPLYFLLSATKGELHSKTGTHWVSSESVTGSMRPSASLSNCSWTPSCDSLHWVNLLVKSLIFPHSGPTNPWVGNDHSKGNLRVVHAMMGDSELAYGQQRNIFHRHWVWNTAQPALNKIKHYFILKVRVF